VRLPVEKLWFIDEFGMPLGMTRNSARAPRGERAEVLERFDTGGNISVISALTLRGVRVPLMIKGAVDGEVLEHYVEQGRVPEWQPGDIVLWDNVPTPKNWRAIALIEGAGAGVEPLPAYSPDLDPIEECISKVQAYLRRMGADTISELQRALKQAIAPVTLQDIRGGFRHCGYAVT
jgi:transposase